VANGVNVMNVINFLNFISGRLNYCKSG
jgi:hypothetical protein